MKRISSRRLWLGLALLLALSSLVSHGLTQRLEDLLNALLVWGGALFVLVSDRDQAWHPRPSPVGSATGAALVVLVLWRQQQLTTLDATSSVLPLLAGAGLVLLAEPPRRRWAAARVPLAIFAILPLLRLALALLSDRTLSLITAKLTAAALMLCGIPATLEGNVVQLPGGGVAVADSCSGQPTVVQLIGVGLIFAVAFPMRYRWQSAVMLLVAPLLGLLVNALRITGLALLTASSLPWSDALFRFFHEDHGALIFSGLAVVLFAWLYGLWMEAQLAHLRRQ